MITMIVALMGLFDVVTIIGMTVVLILSDVNDNIELTVLKTSVDDFVVFK